MLPHLFFMLDVFIVLPAVLINTILAAIIFHYNRKPLANKLFLFSILFVILFAVANFRIDTAATVADAAFALKLFILSGYIFTYLFFLFTRLFSGPVTRRELFSPLHILLFVYTLVFVPFALFLDLAFNSVTIGPDGLEGIAFGPLYLPLFIGMLVLLILNFAVLIKKQKETRDIRTKYQFKYMLLGWSLFILGTLIVGGIIPFFIPAAVNASKVVPLFSIFMVGCTTYAIVRHEFLDIRIIIQRGIIYTVLLTFIVALYFVLIGIFGYALEQTTDIALILAALITSIIGIFSTPMIDRYLRRVTDRFLFKDTYDYSEALYTLSKILNTNIDFEALKEESSQALQDILRASSVAIDFNPHAIEIYQDVRTDDDGMVVPIQYEGVTKGSVVVGAKLSGDPFSRQDMALIRTFSEQASIALEKARLFKEVEDYSLELENKVEERTKKIQKLQKDQESMIMDISHGLQNPLVLAKIEVDSMKKTAPGHKTLETLEHAIDNISGFIYKLMHLTKLEREDGAEKRDTVSLSALLEELVEYFEILTQEKHIVLMHVIEPDIVFTGNRERLEELITNIVSNAVKYNIRNIPGKKIQIELKRENNGARLSVEDTGVGIDPEELPFIFDRFYQSKKHQALGVRSHGLGLSIVKRIVDLHGGTIAVESRLNHGTRVSIFFPNIA